MQQKLFSLLFLGGFVLSLQAMKTDKIEQSDGDYDATSHMIELIQKNEKRTAAKPLMSKNSSGCNTHNNNEGVMLRDGEFRRHTPCCTSPSAPDENGPMSKDEMTELSKRLTAALLSHGQTKEDLIARFKMTLKSNNQ